MTNPTNPVGPPPRQSTAVAEPPRLRKKYSRCDSCGQFAPDVVGPILIGIEGWRTFEIDGVYQGRAWKTNVLLCGSRSLSRSYPRCADRMAAFVNGVGPRPGIRTTEGGWLTEDEFAASLTFDESAGAATGREGGQR